MSSRFEFPKLKDESNYTAWSIRAEAYLIKEGFINTLSDIIQKENIEVESSIGSESLTNSSYIAVLPANNRKSLDNKGLACLKLIVEDGPLNHIKYSTSLGEAWVTLKSLYDKEGFSGLFILIKRFISIPCKKDHINEFLNTIKEVVNNLDSKGVKLLDVFINA